MNHVVLIHYWRELVSQGHLLHARPYTVAVFTLQDVGIGFALTLPYAMARPRLGPGPKKALIMGSFGWFLWAVPQSLFQWLWLPFPGAITVTFLIGSLLQCWVATYVAGWQYIEKAP